jgi:hypothetical protein
MSATYNADVLDRSPSLPPLTISKAAYEHIVRGGTDAAAVDLLAAQPKMEGIRRTVCLSRENS